MAPPGLDRGLFGGWARGEGGAVGAAARAAEGAAAAVEAPGEAGASAAGPREPPAKVSLDDLFRWAVGSEGACWVCVW